MQLSKIKSVDGGKICASCKSCCQRCGWAVGYFTPDLPGAKEISADILEAIYTINDTEPFGPGSGPDVKPTSYLNAVKLLSEKLGRFDEKTGFLGPKGCTIPREKRSAVCVSFYCDKIEHLIHTAEEIGG
jgi:hypothetical protein